MEWTYKRKAPPKKKNLLVGMEHVALGSRYKRGHFGYFAGWRNEACGAGVRTRLLRGPQIDQVQKEDISWITRNH